MSGVLDDLQVFHGAASTTLACVYARLPAREATAGCELVGRVVGPRCRWSQTLTAANRLVGRAASGNALFAEALLAEAVVPDPCFWSDALPMLYSVEVQLRRGGETIAATERPIGFRGVGRRGRSLFQEGRRWVPRGMHAASVVSEERDDLTAWRSAPAVMAVVRPTDAVCASASEVGVWLMADVGGEHHGRGNALDSELSRLARHTAVFVAVLPIGTPATRSMRMAAPNLLLAERPVMAGAVEASPYADCLVLDATDAEAFAVAVRETTLPIIAQRALKAAVTLVDARRASDGLQRDLAQFGDFGGYIV